MKGIHQVAKQSDYTLLLQQQLQLQQRTVSVCLQQFWGMTNEVTSGKHYEHLFPSCPLRLYIILKRVH